MSVPADCARVTFGGALPAGERWQSGFWTHGETPTDNATANALADLWDGQLTSTDSSGPLNAMETMMTAGITLDFVRVYCYPTGGTTATVIGEHASSWHGTAAAQTQPNQCALVVSMRTGLAGRRHRGRMYIPVNGVATMTNSQVPSSQCDDAAAAWGLCFSDWNASGDNGTVVVVSQTGTLFAPVTQLIIDSRMDIQRRRANQQSIAHQATVTVTD